MVITTTLTARQKELQARIERGRKKRIVPVLVGDVRDAQLAGGGSLKSDSKDTFGLIAAMSRAVAEGQGPTTAEANPLGNSWKDVLPAPDFEARAVDRKQREKDIRRELGLKDEEDEEDFDEDLTEAQIKDKDELHDKDSVRSQDTVRGDGEEDSLNEFLTDDVDDAKPAAKKPAAKKSSAKKVSAASDVDDDSEQDDQDDGFDDSDPDYADDNDDDVCATCNKGGSLMQCYSDDIGGTSCGKWVHAECVGLKTAPDQDWICNDCLKKLDVKKPAAKTNKANSKPLPTRKKRNAKKQDNSSGSQVAKKAKIKKERATPWRHRLAGEPPETVRQQQDASVRQKVKSAYQYVNTLQRQSIPVSRRDDFEGRTREDKALAKRQSHFPFNVHGLFCFTDQNPNGDGSGGGDFTDKPELRLFVGSSACAEWVKSQFVAQKEITQPRAEDGKKRLAFRPCIFTDFEAYVNCFRGESAKNKPPPPQPTTSTVKVEQFADDDSDTDSEATVLETGKL